MARVQPRKKFLSTFMTSQNRSRAVSPSYNTVHEGKTWLPFRYIICQFESLHWCLFFSFVPSLVVVPSINLAARNINRRDLEAVARRDGRSTESNASTSMGANSCSDPDVDRMSPANETIRDEFQDDPGSEDPVETSEKESAAKARTLRPPRPPTWNSGKPLRGSVRCSDTPSSVMMPSEVTALFRAPLRGSSIFAPCMSTHAAASVSSSASKA